MPPGCSPAAPTCKSSKSVLVLHGSQPLRRTSKLFQTPETAHSRRTGRSAPGVAPSPANRDVNLLELRFQFALSTSNTGEAPFAAPTRSGQCHPLCVLASILMTGVDRDAVLARSLLGSEGPWGPSGVGCVPCLAARLLRLVCAWTVASLPSDRFLRPDLGRNQPGDLIGPPCRLFVDRAQLRPLDWRGHRPGREGRPRCRHRRVHITLVVEHDPTDCLLAGRVLDLVDLGTCECGQRPADVNPFALDHGVSLSFAQRR